MPAIAEPGAGGDAPVALWWGRFDPDYARNRILRQALESLGWQCRAFRPRLSAAGDVEALARGVGAPALVWVPCFRQRDAAAARRFARRVGAPVLFDPLISAYDKQVFERRKFAPASARARALRRWEGLRMRGADVVLADTEAHAAWFADTLGVDATRLHVVPVGAEEALFRPAPPRSAPGPVEVLFYGSFIGLQRPQIIVEAARRLDGAPVRWTLLGDGPLRAECERLARGLAQVRFEDWLDYAALPARIAAADIALGVFGTGAKTARVIPNKVYQSLACARPVVTAAAPAYPAALGTPARGLHFVAPGDAAALAAAVAALAAVPAALARESSAAGALYARYFSNRRVREALAAALAGAGVPTGAPPAAHA